MTDIVINEAAITSFVASLQTDKVLQDKLTNILPETRPDVVTYALNPNCSCKYKIIHAVRQNYARLVGIFPDSAKEAIDSVKEPIAPKPKVTDKSKVFTQEQEERMLKPLLPTELWAKYEDVIGEIVEIDADPNKYKELITHAKKSWFYNGMNILESKQKIDDKEKVIWRIFFY